MKYDIAINGEPILTALAIEINSNCNRKCDWCPVGHYDREISLLDDKIFYKVIDELKEMKFDGKITFSLYNEPLLDKRILKFIKYIRKNISSTHIYLNTNGDALTLTRWKNLRNAGLDVAKIFQYDGKINENIQKIINELNGDEKSHFQAHIFNEKNINSRAGLVKSDRPKVPWQKPCYRPFYQLCIDYKGKVVLCCNDYFGKITIGDAGKESIKELWANKILKFYRKKLLRGDRASLELCKLCDHHGL